MNPKDKALHILENLAMREFHNGSKLAKGIEPPPMSKAVNEARHALAEIVVGEKRLAVYELVDRLITAPGWEGSAIPLEVINKTYKAYIDDLIAQWRGEAK